MKRLFFSGRNINMAMAFGLGLIVTSLLMDFPQFSEPFAESSFTTAFSHLLAYLTAQLIDLAGYTVSLTNSSIMFNPTNGVYFDFSCLGYRQVIWFIVFMIIIRGPALHKLWYIPMGAIVIQISNVLRAAIIAIVNYHSPQSFELIHTQGSIWMIYGTVLTLWLIWLSMYQDVDKQNK
ncbi:MAG: archaeosortase/exosortase family protein [Salinivirgaceae bacterium]